MEEESKPETQEEKTEVKEVKEEPKRVEVKEKKPGLLSKIKEKLKQYRRTIEVSRKPDREEFTSSTKITGIGILLLGVIGFIIFIIYHIIRMVVG